MATPPVVPTGVEKSMDMLPFEVTLVNTSNEPTGVEKPACAVLKSPSLGAIFQVLPPAVTSWMPAMYWDKNAVGPVDQPWACEIRGSLV